MTSIPCDYMALKCAVRYGNLVAAILYVLW